MRASHTHHRLAFSLIELLVVIAIIAVLLALLLPGVQKVRETANRMQCQNHLKQLALAAHDYQLGNEAFPPGTVSGQCNSVFITLLPYIEQGNLFNVWSFTPAGTANWGTTPTANASRIIPTFLCPSDYFPTPTENYDGYNFGWTSYGGNAGTRSYYGASQSKDGIFYLDSHVRMQDITDGASNTFLFGERSHLDFNLTSVDPGDDMQTWGAWAPPRASFPALATTIRATSSSALRCQSITFIPMTRMSAATTTIGSVPMAACIPVARTSHSRMGRCVFCQPTLIWSRSRHSARGQAAKS